MLPWAAPVSLSHGAKKRQSRTARAGGVCFLIAPPRWPAPLHREIPAFPGAAAGSQPCGPPLGSARPGAGAEGAQRFLQHRSAPARVGRRASGPWLRGGSAGREGVGGPLPPGALYRNGAITGRKAEIFSPLRPCPPPRPRAGGGCAARPAPLGKLWGGGCKTDGFSGTLAQCGGVSKLKYALGFVFGVFFVSVCFSEGGVA